jgi:hypothetical protein
MENKKFKLSNNFAAILICMAVCLLCGCATHTGTRNGQVFDGATNKPIEGAVVNYTWRYEGLLEDAIVGHGGEPITYETLTDNQGKYFIPDMTIERKSSSEIRLRPELVIIYKDEFGAYKVFSGESVGISFGEKERQPYHKNNNIVKLYLWKEGESHEQHLFGINAVMTVCGKTELLTHELTEEKRRAREEALAKHKK